MSYIIPLAGPDFIQSDGTLRPLYQVNDEFVLRNVILSRPWIRSGEYQTKDLIVILRETPHTELCIRYLNQWFNGIKIILLPQLTQGPLLSALAGVSVIDDFDKPLCVDLADIKFDCLISPTRMFRENKALKGIMPYFCSDLPCYSYLTIQAGWVTNVKEKHVISNNASAGVYIFRNAATFLDACMWSLLDGGAIEGCYYVSPAFHTFCSLKQGVAGVEVRKVVSFSETFHKAT